MVQRHPHWSTPALPPIVYNAELTRVYTARDRGYVNSFTAVLDVHVYVCWWRSRLAKKVPHMMSDKVSRCMKSPPGYTRSPGMNKTVPRVFQQGCNRYQGTLPRTYRTYQSGGYGYGSRTELTKVSGMGMHVVPNLPKGRVRL